MPSSSLTLEQALDQARQAQHQGQAAQAQHLLQQMLQAQPTYAPAWHQLGILYAQTGHAQASLECLQKTVALQAENPYFHNDLGNVYLSLKRWTKAQHCFQQALHLKADFPVALHNLGSAYYNQQRFIEAEQALKSAVALQPDYAKAHYTLGVVLLELNDRLDEAEASFQQALRLEPAQHIGAYHGLANISLLKAQVETALSYYRLSLQQDKTDKAGFCNFLFALNYSADYSLEQVFAYHQQFAKRFAPPPADKPTKKRYSHKKLRIAYVSEDLRATHPVAYFIESVLAHHDLTQFDVFCYALHAHQDDTPQALSRWVQHWVACADWTDAQLIERIQQDEIDILIDLMGHTGSNRLQVFAQKPAPVQVSYLGYPNTTGLPAMDYRITDVYVSPPQAERYSSEKLLRLPSSYHCYTPSAQMRRLSVKTLPATQAGFVTFASFNKHEKISPQIFSAWVQLLHRCPRAHLLIKNASLKHASIQQQLKQQFAQAGIAEQRLQLIGHLDSFTQHLQLYDQIDISLDTWPYNGATTTCESLWMGVPVISLCGDTQASRVGFSILSTIGLEAWVAHSLEDYVTKAANLAEDESALQQLREGMRTRLLHSPLLGAETLTRHIEALYRNITAS